MCFKTNGFYLGSILSTKQKRNAKIPKFQNYRTKKRIFFIFKDFFHSVDRRHAPKPVHVDWTNNCQKKKKKKDFPLFFLTLLFAAAAEMKKELIFSWRKERFWKIRRKGGYLEDKFNPFISPPLLPLKTF